MYVEKLKRQSVLAEECNGRVSLTLKQKGEVENSEFSENSETSENQFSEVFNSEFSVLYHTQNRKVGVEN